ncbi:hypothetical protein [Marinoscillum furvescens]|uniref:Uncharacterized protein n=1 Tax=Marinoscillum furvescens DSM 4134 TaxID=1122208 RepID=A0A3D9L5N1_MARFU|nr:hypothetical protein [Marinoscillum furvescens]RED99841.1 hypothetical protein C7460_107124 [Marinoscillum furvescens DSM 4134]
MKTTVKTIFSAAVLSFFVASATIAQSGAPITEQGIEQQSTKAEIDKNKLPAKVSRAIANSDYAQWEIHKAYRVIKDGETMYEVQFKNDQGQVEKQTFDKEGDTKDA